MPVIGFLNGASADRYTARLRGFRLRPKGDRLRRGRECGDRIPMGRESTRSVARALPVDLVRRRVAVIAAPELPNPMLAARAATTTIPVVFLVGEDPVKLGLVASLGSSGRQSDRESIFFNSELVAKRLALLQELVPAAARVAVLVNPADSVNAETVARDLDAAARTMRLQIQLFKASTSREIDATFAALVQTNVPDALFVSPDGFFNSRRVQLAHHGGALRGSHDVPYA